MCFPFAYVPCFWCWVFMLLTPLKNLHTPKQLIRCSEINVYKFQILCTWLYKIFLHHFSWSICQICCGSLLYYFSLRQLSWMLRTKIPGWELENVFIKNCIKAVVKAKNSHCACLEQTVSFWNVSLLKNCMHLTIQYWDTLCYYSNSTCIGLQYWDKPSVCTCMHVNVQYYYIYHYLLCICEDMLSLSNIKICYITFTVKNMTVQYWDMLSSKSTKTRLYSHHMHWDVHY